MEKLTEETVLRQIELKCRLRKDENNAYIMTNSLQFNVIAEQTLKYIYDNFDSLDKDFISGMINALK